MSVLRREEEWKQTQTEQKVKTEAEIGEMPLQAKGRQESQIAREARRASWIGSPLDSQKEPTRQLQASGHLNCEKTHICYFKAPCLW